jgi:ribosomal protein S27AE
MDTPWQEQQVPLPKHTPAFYCGNCGAVSLDSHGICKPVGRMIKADWCGTKDTAPPKPCFNRVHNVRFSCGNCGKVAVNSELLCDPRPMPAPDKQHGR